MRILTLNYDFPPISRDGSWLTSFIWEHCNGAKTSEFAVSYELGKELVAQGHDVDVVTMGFEGLPSSEVVDGINVYRVPCIRTRLDVCQTREMASFVLAALPKVAKLAATHAYDVNHTHFIVPTGLVARLLQVKTGLPFVISLHGSDVPGHNPDRFAIEHRLLSPVWRWILKGADHLIAPSVYLRDLADRQRHQRPTTVIPHGFRQARFGPDPVKEKRILVVARLGPAKDVQYLIEGLRTLALSGFSVEVVGDGPSLPELRHMASAMQLPVRFWGELDNQSAELKHLYETSSILVLPSAAGSFRLMLLEAMASGLAIVTCTGTDGAEVVGHDALLVPPRRPDDLREALDRLIGDEGLRRDLADRARARVEREYGWGQIAKRYVDIYRGISRQSARSRALPLRPSASPPLRQKIL